MFRSLKYIFVISCLMVLQVVSACAQQANEAKVTRAAQIDTTNSSMAKIFTFVDKQPAPPYDFNKYSSENVHYPDSAIDKNIQGKVIARFIVNEDGSASDITIVRSVDRDLDTEVLTVLRQMPVWTPGYSDGKPVKTYFTQPVTFRLDSNRYSNYVIDSTHKPDSNGVYRYLDVQPKPGYDFQMYLCNNLHYPVNSRDRWIQGKVLVRFIVNEDGSASNFTILKSVNPELDNEALRVLKQMPKWMYPGMNDGKPVKVYFAQPITFRLE